MVLTKSNEPGGELNFKAKRRWEVLRRTENYRRDWDEPFIQMVRMLKEFPRFEAGDLGCEPTREKMKKAISELMKAFGKITNEATIIPM
jgi:hypothetical protein